VKRTILFVAGIAALAAVASFGAAWAQSGGGVAPAAPPATKVGVVNVGTVFSKYQKALAYKEELQKTIAPFKLKAEGWRKEMIQYKEFLDKKDFSKYTKEGLEKGIIDRQRALEDMDKEVRKLIGAQQEEQLVQLWKEVTSHIRAYGASRGFHILLGYGDPLEAKDLETFPNINRKMQGMDLGGVCPLYIAAGLDISEDVVLSLNTAYQQNRPVVPAGGPAVPK
jgi:Skp family chaperone for outer membrane proteins